MSKEDGSIDLFRAILNDNCSSDEAAQRHLAEAARLGVDPLDYCAHRFGLGEAIVWRRAAQWAGYGFADITPSRLPLPKIDRLEHLSDLRTFRQQALGRELTFVAPGFARVLTLAATKIRRPGFGGHIRFTPPAAIEAAATRAASDQLMDGAVHGLARRWPQDNAATGLSHRARFGFALLLCSIIVLALAAGLALRPVLVPVVALLLLAPGLIRLVASIPHREAAPEPPQLGDHELPVYTVLIPLRDEAAMVPMLYRAMSGLDYPPEKLDIKFVVEARSPETVAAVRTLLGDAHFRLIEVPPGKPATKPKALDYALPLARGRYVVVYDAEDVPEPDQLRRAASRFEADPALVCLQAELVPDNATETALTALFAGEYAGLFGRLLPALARWGWPVPLGGTSNHFRTATLRDIGGWDAFNVTEDADLGVRLARRGLKAATLASRTYEEAPVTLLAFMAQRTRWMKGWMLTFIVHNRRPQRLLADLGWRGFLAFQALVGGMIVAALLHTVFAGALLGRLIFEGLDGFVPGDMWDWASAGILCIGYGGAFAVVTSGLAHQGAMHLLPMQLLLPAYWVLHSIATLNAAVELFRRPSHWSKTTHGVTRQARRRAEAPAFPVSAPIAAEAEI
jgi:cellulose synthase/poly-beta-1,6-N-acetylglucosamine synthase-like glycosyltransferase